MPNTPDTSDKTLSEMGYLKHEQDNIEVELRLFEGKLSTLEESLSLLRQELVESQQGNQRLITSSLAESHDSIARFQATLNGFVEDLRQLKTHANDLEVSFSQYKRRFSEFEQVVDRHSRNISNLETAIRSLTALVKDAPSNAPAAIAASKRYKVQSGDTLEKIAKANNTTVQQLKEVNQLRNDLIIVGQEIVVPR